MARKIFKPGRTDDKLRSHPGPAIPVAAASVDTSALLGSVPTGIPYTWTAAHVFLAGLTGALTGNASTATALQTARQINGVSFNGTADITVAAAAGTLTGTTLAAGVTASSLTSVGTLTGLTVNGVLSIVSNVLAFKTSSNRFLAYIGGDEEGANSGSDFFLQALNDAGSSIDFPLSVVRAAGGNIVFGTGRTVFASTFFGALTGNASTATALATARQINGVNFDGTGNITVTAAAGTLTGATLASGVTASSLTSVGTLVNLTVTNPITGSISGNAGTATTLQTARNINGVSFDGSAAITVAAAAGTLTGSTLASGVTASSLTSVGTLASLAVTGAITAGGSVTSGTAAAVGGAFITNAPTLASGTIAELLQIKTNSVNKWLIRCDVDETGSDAGCDLNFLARTDAGAIIDRPIVLIRQAAGAIKLGVGSTNRPVVCSGELRVDGDIGGQASCNTLTGTSDLTTNSTGVGTILFKGTTSRNSTGFMKFYVGTTAYYVPVFSAITG